MQPLVNLNKTKIKSSYCPKLFHLTLTPELGIFYPSKFILNFYDKFYTIVFLIFLKNFGYRKKF